MSGNAPYEPYPSVTPAENIPGARISTQASPNAFGAQIAAGGEALGQAGEKAALQQQAYANELDAMGSSLKGVDAHTQSWDWFGQLEGKASHDALPKYKAEILANTQKALDAAPNDQQRSQVARELFRSTQIALQRGESHADAQLKHWAERTNQDYAKTMADQAALDYANEPAVAGHIGEGAGKLDQHLKDKGFDATARFAETAKYRGQVWGNVIAQALLQGNLPYANHLFDAHKSEMDASAQLTVTKLLHPANQNEMVQAFADVYYPMEPGKASGKSSAAFSPDVNAAIEKASAATGVSRDMLNTFARIESSGDPAARTGKYHGLFQLGVEEFAKHRGGDIYNAEHNAMAAARKIAEESRDFKNRTGQDATPFDLYMIHQQGAAGHEAHVAAPEGVAWENVRRYYSSDAIAKKAIWDNIPSDRKQMFPGGVNSVTSGQFEALWKDKYDRLSGGAEGAAVPGGAPDRRQAAQLAHQFAHGDLELERKLTAEINRRHSILQTHGNGERATVEDGLADIAKDAENGVARNIEDWKDANGAPLTEGRIRAALPAQKAERVIQAAHMQKAAAEHWQGALYGPPEDARTFLADAADGFGVMRPGAEPEGPEGARAKAHAFAFAQKQLKARDDMLKDDPASFAGSAPAVKPAAEALGAAAKAYQLDRSPDNAKMYTGAYQAHATALLAAQEHMGVDEEHRHILTKDDARRQAEGIGKAANPKEIIDDLARRYGDKLWPKAFHDLVVLGGLPAPLEAMRYLDDKNAEYLAMGVAATKGLGGKDQKAEKAGEESWNERLGKVSGGGRTKAIIDDAIAVDPNHVAMMRSLTRRGASAEVVDNYDKTAKLLAYSRFIHANNNSGESAADAVANASKAFAGQYTFTRDGAAIPSSNYKAVTTAMGEAQGRLTPDAITTPAATRLSGQGYVSPVEYVRDVKSYGYWSNSPNSDGVALRDKSGNYVLDVKGQPITVKFKNPEQRMQEAGEAPAVGQMSSPAFPGLPEPSPTKEEPKTHEQNWLDKALIGSARTVAGAAGDVMKKTGVMKD